MTDKGGQKGRAAGAPEWVLVGRVKRIHGKDGEMLIMPLSDNPERFAPGSRLFLSRKHEDERLPVTVTASRPSDRGPLIRLEGYNSRESADELFSAYLFVPGAEIPQPAPGGYFPFQLEGLEVFAGERTVGRVSQVHESAKANPYLEVEPESGEEPVFIPFVREVILSVDLDRRRIDIPADFL